MSSFVARSMVTMYWQYDGRSGRRWSRDPVVKHHESPYATFGNNPIAFIDPNGADTAVFGKNNKFLNIKPGGDHVGQKLGKDGFFFQFADAENDIKDIAEGRIDELYIPTEDEILNDLDRAGVNEDENRGPIDGIKYLLNNSSIIGNQNALANFTNVSEIHGFFEFEGSEFPEKLKPNLLYITNFYGKRVGHNDSNFGNFLWGAASHAVGFSRQTSLTGAHLNNYFNDVGNIEKGWLDRDFDSPDDQFSISMGWYWFDQNKQR